METNNPPNPLPDFIWKLNYKRREWIESGNSNGTVVVVSVLIVIVTELT
jgi:hypothetical protein